LVYKPWLMQKLLLLVIMATIICSAHAQTQKSYVVPQTKFYVLPYKTFTADTTWRKNPPRLVYQNDTVLIPGSMPVVGLNSVQLTYQYNNGKGLDVYKANTDNMPVVKPDSTFYSPMQDNNRYKIIMKPRN